MPEATVSTAPPTTIGTPAPSGSAAAPGPRRAARAAAAGRPTTAWRLLLRNPLAMVGLAFIAAWTLGAVVVMFLPNSPTATGVGGLLEPPSGAHPFGTDNFGRDIFARVLA